MKKMSNDTKAVSSVVLRDNILSQIKHAELYKTFREILTKKYKGKRCSQYCSVWNSEDWDCEIMGEYHLSPSRCRWFLMQELRREIENDSTNC